MPCFSSRRSLILCVLFALFALHGCKKKSPEDEQDRSGDAVSAESDADTSDDVAAAQSFETVNVDDGFELVSREAVAGGGARGNDFGVGCAGFVSEEPLLRLNVQSQQPIRVTVESKADTTLIIKGPGGPFCNDDFDRLNPGVEETFAVGEYDIYVGVYDVATGNPPVTIHAQPYQPRELKSPQRQAEPRYQTLALTGDIEAQSFDITAGGDQRADEMNLAPMCTGFIAAAAPDMKLEVSSLNAPLVIRVTSDEDVTLVAQSPDGQWHCNDDADGSNPRLDLKSPADGVWGVWVGTYAPRTAEAKFSVEPGETPDAADAE